MNLTFEQLKKELSGKKDSMVYYSPFTLWWTHAEVDVEKASIIGRQGFIYHILYISIEEIKFKPLGIIATQERATDTLPVEYPTMENRLPS